MTIELKHLAPYLPYGLYFKCEDIESGEYEELPLTAIILSDGKQDLVIGNQECDIDDLFANEYECLFPILIPLSDFEDINSEQMNNLGIDMSTQIDLCDLAIKYKHYTEMSYTTMLICFENHIDVFGLIEQGLAIDINTLKS